MQYVKKITTASVGLKTEEVEALAIEKNRETPVMRAYGRITGSVPGISTYGPYIRFTGEIEAVNLISGEKYRSQNIILTEVAQTALNDALAKAHSKDPKAVVEFGLDITVSPTGNDKGGWKFRYGVKSLLEPKGSDVLSELGESLGKLPMLEEKSKSKK